MKWPCVIEDLIMPTQTTNTIDDYKREARILRDTLAGDGKPISHSQALETVARLHGHRDWNTLHAAALSNRPPPLPGLGDRVGGTFLGQKFSGVVLGVQSMTGGLTRFVIRFDEPVDVVTHDSFSSFRSRVTALVDDEGISPQRTSNGTPHMVLRQA